MSAEQLNTRQKNMRARRERILAQARHVLVNEGYDALNTRDLARAAGVTPPTLYNLIGAKDEIVRALTFEAVERIEEKIEASKDTTVLGAAEAIVIGTVAAFEEDELSFRAAFIAADRVSEQASPGFHAEFHRRSVRVALGAVQTARQQKLLRGKVAPETMAEQMFACYSAASRDWFAHHISLEEFSQRALSGFYLILAADAVDTFHATLIKRLNTSSEPSIRERKTRR